MHSPRVWLSAVSLALVFGGPLLADSSVVFSEVRQEESEYIELHNPTTEAVNLGGYSLTGDLGCTFTAAHTIPPGGYVVVAQAPSPILAEFGTNVPMIVPYFHSRVRDGGGSLRLWSPDRTLLDEVVYGASTDGKALHRLDKTTAYRGSLNWVRGDPTPGKAGPSGQPPPLAMDRMTRSTDRPTSRDEIEVTVRIHGASVRAAWVRWQTRTARGEVPMRAISREASSLTFTATIPPQADQSFVHYGFVAEDEAGQRRGGGDAWGGPLKVFVFDGVETKLPMYCFEMGDSQLDYLLKGSTYRQRFPTEFVEIRDGVSRVHSDVTVRVRGNSTQTWIKASWMVQFNGSPGPRGLGGLYLRSIWKDSTTLREVMSYDLFRDAGVPASRARRVRVHVNGKFFGLYTEVEPVDELFLARHDLGGAVLYRGRFLAETRGRRHGAQVHENTAGYELTWSKETFRDESHADIRAFIEGFHDAPAPDLESFLEANLDVERYLRYLAGCALLSHWDSLTKNYYWCLDREGSGKWIVIPWDLDLTWGDYHHGAGLIVTSPVYMGTSAHQITSKSRMWWNALRDHVLSVPNFQRRYLRILRQILKERFVVSTLESDMDQRLRAAWSDTIEDKRRWGALDRMTEMPIRFNQKHLMREIGLMKHYVRARRKFLLQETRRGLDTLGPGPASSPLPRPPISPGETPLDGILVGLLALVLGGYVVCGGPRRGPQI